MSLFPELAREPEELDVDTVSRYLASGNPSDAWCQWLERYGDTPELEAIYIALFEAGRVQTFDEALAWCDESIRASDVLERNTLVLCDFNGGKVRNSFLAELCRQYDLVPKVTLITNHLTLGTTTHWVYEHLLQRHIPAFQPQRTLPLGSVIETLEFPITLNDKLSPDRYRHAVVGKRKIDPNFVSELDAVRRETVRAMSTARPDWGAQYDAGRHNLFELAERLVPIVGFDKVEPIIHLDAYRRYLYLVAMLTWAKAVKLSRSVPKRTIFLTEVPVFKTYGGVADVIQVVSVDGKPPQKRHRRILRQLRAQHSPRPQLVEELVSHFGDRVLIEVLDFKFMVGDGGLKKGTFAYGEIKNAPAGKDQRQVKRYMALLHARFAEVLELNGRAWERRFVRRGTLSYHFPGCERHHRLEPELGALQEVYRGIKDKSRTTAPEKASDRVVTHGLARFVKRAIADPDSGAAGEDDSTATPLFSAEEGGHESP